MYNARDLNDIYSNTVPYKCPTCDSTMAKLSSLYQHVDSNTCDQALNDSVIGQLRNYLASRL